MTQLPDASHATTDGSERRMGVFFPLADFEQRIAADPDVLGMMYNGSLGRGEADRCSDIDIKLWVRNEVRDTPELLEHYMGWMGTLHFVFSFGLFGNGYVGPDWQSVDVGILGEEIFEPDAYYAYYHGARIVKDTDDRLAAFVAASPPSAPEVTPESASKVIEEVIHILSHITMYNVRGSRFSAMGNTNEQAINVYGLLARLRGWEPYEVRFVEQFLQPDEYALLRATWPAAPERDEIRRAARALWDWSRYVWAEAERTLGVALDIPVDKDILLTILERPYTWAEDTGSQELRRSE